jgi:2-hydroxy-6-oxonona-2,4-dienedioate hydrolase
VTLNPEGEPLIRASFVDIDGIRTRYLHGDSGKGRSTLLLLHGFGFSADAWLRVIDPLASDYSVVAPDLLGHGFTEWVDPGEAPALLAMTKHVAKFMDKSGIDRCSVIGSSLGSFLGCLLYFERRKQVEKLVIGALHHPVSDTGSLDPISLRATMANGTKAMTDGSLEACINRIGNICFDRNCPASELAFMQTTIYAQHDRLTAYRTLGENFIKHVGNDKARIYPERIEIPTLFLTGREDVRVNVDLLMADYKKIPGAELSLIDKCGHLPELEHPATYVSRLRTFFSAACAEPSQRDDASGH